MRAESNQVYGLGTKTLDHRALSFRAITRGNERDHKLDTQIENVIFVVFYFVCCS